MPPLHVRRHVFQSIWSVVYRQANSVTIGGGGGRLSGRNVAVDRDGDGRADAGAQDAITACRASGGVSGCRPGLGRIGGLIQAIVQVSSAARGDVALATNAFRPLSRPIAKGLPFVQVTDIVVLAVASVVARLAPETEPKDSVGEIVLIVQAAVIVIETVMLVGVLPACAGVAAHSHARTVAKAATTKRIWRLLSGGRAHRPVYCMAHSFISRRVSVLLISNND